MSIPLPRRSWVEQIMGLPVSVLARGDAALGEGAHGAVRAVFDELTGVDRVFSLYRPESVLSRLSRGEIDLRDCGDDVNHVAERCEKARELTGGLFEPTRPDGTWDPSGLVKGWAAERAARHLAAEADLDWCLNAGGDVVVLCPSGQPFTVGIQDPNDTGRVAATISRVSGAVATSGTAARGAHLYDPRTGAAATSRWLSITVAGPSLETADVVATAAFVAGESWPELVDRLDGYEGLGIVAAGSMSVTTGWPVPSDTGRGT